MRLIYLAGPIDQVGREELATDRRRAKDLLTNAGFTVYDPSTAMVAGAAAGLRDRPDDTRVYQIHRDALRRSDGILALLPSGVPSIGTPMECEQAVETWNLPCVVVGGAGLESWYLAGRPDRILTVREEEMAVAVQWLEEEIGSRKDGDWQLRPWQMRVKDLGEGRLPSRAYEGDAGFDLYTSQAVQIEGGDFLDIPCEIAVEMPEFAWGLLVGRSSTLRRRNLLVNTGIIDTGYRGPIYAGVKNLNGEMVRVEKGERLAQLIPLPNLAREIAPVWSDSLSTSDRDQSGFGSSGV